MLRMRLTSLICFFFNDTATTEIYTLSLHDALPISRTIDVVQSVQDTSGTTVQVGALTGRVTSIDRRSNVVRVDSGRGEVRVDLANAYDTSGRRVRASDMQVGDRVDLSGNYSGDMFVASTVR